MTDTAYAFIGNLEKRRDEQGFLHVKGIASDDTLDLDGQICDPEWLAGAMSKWFKTGNIREMHGASAVGKATKLDQNGNAFSIEAKIVDPLAATKFEEGVYTGFSIGIKGYRLDKSAEALKRAPEGIINGGDIIEISGVDRPANPSAVCELVKLVEGELVKTEVVADGCPPCETCNGVGTVADGSECDDCKGTGEGSINTYPSLNGGDNEDGEVGKKLEADTDQFGWSDEDKAAWTPFQKQLMPDSVKKDYSDKERKQLASSGAAMPGGGYPIKTVQDLKNAIQAIGRAKDPVAAKAHIKARAKALGQEALIPDSWKASTALAGLVATLSKGATEDQWMHDPEALAQTRDGLVACIVAELGEFAEGDDERWDIEQLTGALNTFLSWWQDESQEGETSSPFTGETMSFIGMGVNPDVVKAALADEATDADKTALRDEVVKSLGIEDALNAQKEVLQSEIDTLKSELDGVKKMAAPRNISKAAGQFQQDRFHESDALSAQADKFKALAMESPDPLTRSQYMQASADAKAQSDAIRKSLEGDN